VLKLFVMAQNAFASFRDREEGQTMAEYGVVLAVITLGIIAALTFLRDEIADAFNDTGSKL
jgi:Flp pilus assembly pilin Flp